MSVLTFRQVAIDDALAEPLVRELTAEYVSRYGPDGHREMSRFPSVDFAPPTGLLILLLADGAPVAGGAYRRYDPDTAEIKRMWTHSAHRRRGHARLVLAELERRAGAAGYWRIHLTTGPRQPEAQALYLAAGYTPQFDPEQPPNGPLAFAKRLTTDPGEARTP
ncbi:GNAT family N-acetyltransferase [Kitasatospora viridis]|uniref:Acetyltransferase (GNAT) family protein n=1 Tax=Kitasatospora viridis TaxID=281105 RepID=A0A561UF22_9ACTN|nr:GNAT family N-acetyltransferase [Kitasatospora viridis]TWF97930.1 acetyltransferase (GNAT) family protein [Kitasatospora viridis]